jgi:hypothetical protein
MCLLASLVRPFNSGRPEIPTENGPDILYPGLKRPSPEEPSVADAPRVHQAGFDVISRELPNLVPETQKFLEDPGNYKFPKWLMGPQAPLILPSPRLDVVPVPRSPLAPTPPRSLFSPLPPKHSIPNSLGGSPTPQLEPPAPTPAQPPKPPESKGLVPPELKDILKPILGGTQTLPPGGFIELPDGPPQLDMPLVLMAQVVQGERTNKGREVQISVGKAEESELAKTIPRYREFQDLAQKAADVIGEGKGKERGSAIHRLFDKIVLNQPLEEGEKIWVEYTLDEKSYGTKGMDRVDVYVEKGRELRIYELKTGTAQETLPRARRVLNYKSLEKYDRIIFVEVRAK